MMIYRDATQPVEKRVEDLLNQMTLEEKIAQLGSVWIYEIQDGMELSPEKLKVFLSAGMGEITRIGGGSLLAPVVSAETANAIQRYLLEETRLGIPAIVHEECCSGYTALGATCFPQMIGLASTFMPDLAEKMTTVIRQQMRAVGAHQGLSPVLDVTREPRWGRTEETFGEDPLLVAEIGAAYVRGLQGNGLLDGVMATAKHFLGHGISEGGLNCTPVHVGPRELRNVYAYPFEAAIRNAKVASIMNAYSELDEEVVAASKSTLTHLLRDELGFDGLVSSDYESVLMLHSFHKIANTETEAGCLALEAGIDVELPATRCYGKNLIDAIQSGRLDEAYVNRAVRRILQKKFELGLFENPFVDPQKVLEIFDTSEQRDLAREIARKSMVLLKNERELLPLRPGGTIAVIGPNADSGRNLAGDYSHASHIENLIYRTPEVKDVLLANGASEMAGSVKFETVLAGIRKQMSSGKVLYARGCDVNSTDRSGFEEALEAARHSDVVVMVLGDKSGLAPDCTCGESRDRSDLGLPGMQEELLRAVVEIGKPVVLVLVNGRPVALPWAADHLPAILEAWLPGEEGGAAVAEVLFGQSVPGGKLPISVPRSVGQLPVFYNHKTSGGRSYWHGDYVEDSTRPLYPFGHGLSYTTFEYSDLVIDSTNAVAGGTVPVTVSVRNSGKAAGDEVVQLYVFDEFASIPRPVKELKGFARIHLLPGESRRVTFQLPVNLLAFYDDALQLVVEPGLIRVYVGSSSEDIRQEGSFEIRAEGKTCISERVFSCPLILG